MLPTAAWEDIYKIVYLEHHDPYSVLGTHNVEIGGKDVVTVRAFLPSSKEAYVSDMEDNEKEYKMYRLHKEGFYEVAFPHKNKQFPYMLKTVDENGDVEVFRDSYSFLSPTSFRCH